jgi:hypothetical protein
VCCQNTSKTKFVTKSRFSSFALTLLSASAFITVAGCADIPKAEDDETSIVTVEVIGGTADIFPGQEFSVPVGGDTLLFVGANREPNTRIVGIWVDGGKHCCAEESVVRDTGIVLFGVGGGIAVIIELAKIDTVPPVVEIVSPAIPAPGEPLVNISVCSFGAIEYRLNKTMAFGYIRWKPAESDSETADLDSLRVIRIPGDITKYKHDNGGGWSYASPDGYLSEGLQTFDLKISPVIGKRVSLNQIAAPAAYTFVIQFTDSLGNKSDTVSRMVWATTLNKGCP